MGAIVLPINWRFQKDVLEFVLNDCTPKFAFAGPDYHKTLKEALPKCKSIEKCYAIGGADETGEFTPFAELYAEQGADEEYDIPADAVVEQECVFLSCLDGAGTHSFTKGVIVGFTVLFTNGERDLVSPAF